MAYFQKEMETKDGMISKLNDELIRKEVFLFTGVTCPEEVLRTIHLLTCDLSGGERDSTRYDCGASCEGMHSCCWLFACPHEPKKTLRGRILS